MDVLQAMWKEMESTTAVRFQDCDSFQHLNNARYIDYMLNAWEDQLKNFFDFSLFEHIKLNNAGWVVVRTQIAYLHPAALSEEVTIKTRLVQLAESNIVVEAMMLDRDQKRPKALAWVEFTYISLTTRRPVKHTEESMGMFEVMYEPEQYADGFDQRLENVKYHYRNLAAEV